MTQFPPGKFGGCLPRETEPGAGVFPAYGTDGSVPILDWDAINEWDGDALHAFHWWTPDQKNTRGCTTGMGVNVLSIIRELEGKPRVKHAMAGLYAFDGITIRKDGDLDVYECHHRRSDTGMNLETMFLILQLQGVPPAEIDGVPYVDPLDWKGLRAGRWPGDWREQASKCRLSDEVWDMPNSQAMLSGIVEGYTGARGKSDHAVLQIDKELVLGSWGEDYGTTGAGTVGGCHPWGDLSTERGRRDVDNGIQRYGGFCCRASRAEDAPPCEGVVPRIEDKVIRERRRRRWGRR